MAITRTLTKTFKTITRSKSSPFLRKQSDDDDDETTITSLQPMVPPPKQLRLDLDFADTLNLDFHQLDFSDDSKLQAWTEKNTPKTTIDESYWLGERVECESRDRKSVLAPESVSNGFFESPLSTPTTPGSEWQPGPGLSELERCERKSHDQHAPTNAVGSHTSSRSLRHAQSPPTINIQSRDKSLPKPPIVQRPQMSQSKSCSHLPKRTKSHNGSCISPQPTHASQFVKSRVASESHSSNYGSNHRSNHMANAPPTPPHNIGTYGMTNTPVKSHIPTPSVDSFITCTDTSPQLSSSRDIHQRNMSIASVDTVSAYMDPALASTISRYYHLEGVDETPGNRQSRDFPNQQLSHQQSRDLVFSSGNRHSRDFAMSSGNRQSRQSNDSPFNTPSLDDRNSSSTFTMSPSTSTTMSTPSLVDSPSSCASVNVSFEKPVSHGNVTHTQSFHTQGTTQPLHVTPAVPPARPFTLYSTDNDLVPPPRSKYRSRHYRFDSSSSSVYSNNYVKEDYMGALRQSLYVPKDGEGSPSIRPVSAFGVPQISAEDYASAIKEGQWF